MNQAVKDNLLKNLHSTPIEEINLSNPALLQQNVWGEYFARVREEDPVHYIKDSAFGPFWSITKFNDIVFVDSNHKLFSSEPSIMIGDRDSDLDLTTFIAMDQPRHDVERRSVQGVVAPKNLAAFEVLIRERTQKILDSLPIGEPFDWVENVSIELTTLMLATLFDFPLDERKKLTFWSDMATSSEALTGATGVDKDERLQALMDCGKRFTQLWHETKHKEPSFNLISMLQNNPDTKDMVDDPYGYLGNLLLLIVGGNDTTRNSMTGGVLALNQFPDQFVKLKENPDLIPSFVSENIRWQTPLAHMRRVATEDVELGGKTIKKGDKVVMWYISGNRDSDVIENPDQFIVDRKNPRQHISFGFGIHRCMGNRLAEMQLRVLWEEILARFSDIKVLEEPERIESNFVHGYEKMMVTVTAK